MEHELEWEPACVWVLRDYHQWSGFVAENQTRAVLNEIRIYIYIYHYIILHYYLISIKSIAAHKFPTTKLVHHPLAWHLPDLVKDWPDMQFQVQCLRTTCSAGVGSWPPWTQPGVKWTFSRYEMKSVWFDSSVRTIQIINRTPYCLKYIEKYDMISCNSL